MNWVKKMLGMSDRVDSIREREAEIERQPLTVQPPRSRETARILLADVEGKVRAYRTRWGHSPRELVMSRENWSLLARHFLDVLPRHVRVRVEERFDGFVVT